LETNDDLADVPAAEEPVNRLDAASRRVYPGGLDGGDEPHRSLTTNSTRKKRLALVGIDGKDSGDNNHKLLLLPHDRHAGSITAAREQRGEDGPN